MPLTKQIAVGSNVEDHFLGLQSAEELQGPAEVTGQGSGDPRCNAFSCQLERARFDWKGVLTVGYVAHALTVPEPFRFHA